MRSQRVLHVLPTANIEAIGVARIVRAFAQALTEDFETVVSFLDSKGPLVKWFEENGIRSTSIGWSGKALDVIGAARFTSVVRKGKFDVVHVHGGGRALCTAIHAAGALCVRHVHSRVFESGELNPQDVDVFGADLAIATSKMIATHVRGAKARVVIYPCVVTSQVLGEMRRPDGPMVIGTAARLIPLKGIDQLLEAFRIVHRALPEVRLEVVGDGPERSRLEASARELAPGCISFQGWVQDVPAQMRDWTIYVQPSLEDAFGITILEAFAAGVPVVASAVGGIPEVVEQRVSGLLVPAADPQLLAAALLNLLNDAAMRRNLAQGGRDALANKFSEVKMAEEIRKAYAVLLSTQA